MLTWILGLSGVVAAVPVQASDDHGAQASFAVRAQHLRLFGNEVVHDGVLVVENGKVRYAGDAKRAGEIGHDVIEHDGWLSAGLVACRSYSGTRGDTLEGKRPLTAEARIADVVALDHVDFERALAAGITTMVIAPSAANVVSGATAVVKTHGASFVSREAHLALSFSDSALRFNRYPTSYMAALGELENALARPSGVWKRVADGKLPVLLDAGSRDEIQRAVRFAKDHKLQGALSRAPWAGELADDVKQSGLAVIAGPFDVGTAERSLASVVALAKAGVPLAFGVDAPWNSEEGLRLSAAMCMRAGLDGRTAWESLTSTAAAVAGAGTRVGKLVSGYDADFVLWSGDPLDLTSRVVAVYVDGQRAFGGAE